MKLEQSGVGTAETPSAVRDTNGTGNLPIQAAVSGTATFRILGKVSAEAPWEDVKEPTSAEFLESFSWLPYIQLEVTAGTGTVTIFIGEK